MSDHMWEFLVVASTILLTIATMWCAWVTGRASQKENNRHTEAVVDTVTDQADAEEERLIHLVHAVIEEERRHDAEQHPDHVGDHIDNPKKA